VDGQVGSVGVLGDFGLQVIVTDQFSEGGQVQLSNGQAVIVPVRDGISYTNYLPSMNLNFEITDEFKIRLAAGRAIARARLDQLSASRNLGVNITALEQTDPLGSQGSAFSFSGGNPLLRPYLANQVDLTFEQYFGGAAFLSLQFFYKDLNDFVNTGDSFIFDFANVADSVLTPAQRSQLGTTLGLARAPTNNGSGRIRGIEFTASIPLDVVSKWMTGFGFLTSAAFPDSRVTLGSTTNPSAAPVTTTIPGFSRWVVNSSLYFEKWGVEARVSHRFRTQFLAEIAAISATRQFSTSRAESIIDAQLGYAFSGPLEGLRVTAQGLNLTDEPFETIQNGDDRLLTNSQFFGRTFLIGGSYTF